MRPSDVVQSGYTKSAAEMTPEKPVATFGKTNDKPVTSTSANGTSNMQDCVSVEKNDRVRIGYAKRQGGAAAPLIRNGAPPNWGETLWRCCRR